MQNEMRDRLVELIYEARKEWDVYFNDCLLKGKPRSKTLNEFIADYLIENGVIVPPCKVGDYIEWDKGIEKTLYQVKGFLYYENRLRYVFDFFEPVVTHQAITGILTKEEAEQKLKGGADNG